MVCLYKSSPGWPKDLTITARPLVTAHELIYRYRSLNPGGGCTLARSPTLSSAHHKGHPLLWAIGRLLSLRGSSIIEDLLTLEVGGLLCH